MADALRCIFRRFTHITRVNGNKQIHVVVLGAGFGGLLFCKHFRHPNARITVVDRTNHHLFQPLLYQVAACGLSAPEIAQPIRGILSNRPDITVLFNQAVDFDLAQKKVILEKGALDYDYLVLAMGGQTGYFGHPEWEQFAPGLKTLDDALRIRSRILLAFEQAENESDPAERDRLLTIVVVGGGPTGVELAGAFAELTRTVLNHDFRRIDPTKARIILIEGSPLILSHLPPALSASAQRQLEALGVQIRNNIHVKDIRAGEVELANGEIIRAGNILWAAGVSATPLTKKLGVELDKAGRVKVNPDLSLPGHPEIFAVGDMAFVPGENGKPVPGVSPAAMQMGKHVARIIEKEIENGQPLTRPSVTLSPSDGERDGVKGNLGNAGANPTQRPAFKYWDKGTMATIGRSAAVAWIGRFKFSGLLAWLAWLFIHLIFLIGFRNRLAVLFQWTWSYFSYKRSARIITYPPPETTGDSR
ncbi:MAG: NAD(P)/FAD-dependent oxidoreductase [Verrucomicrobia bacterium]|nr:MAG: NAD(P)/FAD-dependent oxidoreductase [Verrucomicrobiota bacterium]